MTCTCSQRKSEGIFSIRWNGGQTRTSWDTNRKIRNRKLCPLALVVSGCVRLSVCLCPVMSALSAHLSACVCFATTSVLFPVCSCPLAGLLFACVWFLSACNHWTKEVFCSGFFDQCPCTVFALICQAGMLSQPLDTCSAMSNIPMKWVKTKL